MGSAVGRGGESRKKGSWLQPLEPGVGGIEGELAEYEPEEALVCRSSGVRGATDEERRREMWVERAGGSMGSVAAEEGEGYETLCREKRLSVLRECSERRFEAEPLPAFELLEELDGVWRRVLERVK